MGIDLGVKSRKARRKEERLSRKKQKRPLDPEKTQEIPASNNGEPVEKKPKKERKAEKKDEISKQDKKSDDYADLDPDLAAAMRNDDLEIADMEEKLGLADEKERKRLHREYVKNEGYGDDFGDFLDDLDDLSKRLSESHPESKERSKKDINIREDYDDDDDVDDDDDDDDDDPYAIMDPELAAEMRRDDEEIADLEAKLGMSNGKDRKKLNREYAKLECYGDDFGDFLDDLDHLPERISKKNIDASHDYSEDDADYSSSDGEGVELMKLPAESLDEDDSTLGEMDGEYEDGSKHPQELVEEGDREKENFSDDQSDDSNSEAGSGSDVDSAKNVPDHDIKDTYKPSQGEDIYGNTTESSNEKQPPSKYVPPHLRKKQEDDEDANRLEALRVIQRSLNNVLNRLSEDTLISVSQSISKLYQSNPTADVNECIWKNFLQACVERPTLMSGLIPVYTACLAGTHFHTGDQVQLGGYLLEKTIIKLWADLRSDRKQVDNDGEGADKGTANLTLILCYLYNYSLVHCTFIYDVIRHLIEKFSELDVEVLLLILSHCGYSLRTDDPSALKEIVLLVHDRALKSQKEDENGTASSSRVQYMISAIMDLKNNKKRKQDVTFGEKTAKLRRLIGRIKSNVASSGAARVSDSNLRISLDDILNIESKGRWWKVGASWVGNQYQHQADDDDDENDDNGKGGTTSAKETKKKKADTNGEDEELLQLASKYRMNTDIRRSIFCIIMGSADCDDAFEKLVRGGMLKGRTERDTVRVLVECCGNEKTHNPFYSHLASRICDFQPHCKFTFQLAYWDLFKQFDTVKMRKAANLAKLLYYLVAIDHSLKMNVLKVIDITDEMSETAGIFLTIFFSCIFDAMDDPAQVADLFHRGIPRVSGSAPMGSKKAMDMNDEDKGADGEGLRESLSVFFLQTLKASPKNKKKSKFRANFKAAVKSCETDGIEF